MAFEHDVCIEAAKYFALMTLASCDEEESGSDPLSSLNEWAVMGTFMRNPYLLACLWMCSGLGLIFFNKTIISVWDFHYPFFLTFLHQVFAVGMTKLLYYYTPLLGSVKSDLLSWEVYLQKVPLMALTYAGALVLSNSAYKFLSLSYIQMLKSQVHLAHGSPIPLCKRQKNSIGCNYV